MHVHDIAVSPLSDGSTRISGRLNEDEVYFVLPPGAGPSGNVADAFLAVALMPAMFEGKPLTLEGGWKVSAPLLEHVRELQDIFSDWQPLLRRIPIEAEPCEPAPAEDRVASFLSGGADSTYTLMRHKGEITDLILMNGFDFTSPPEVFEKTISHRALLAGKLGKRLLPVAVNHIEYCAKSRLHSLLTHGSWLAAVGILLGLRKVRIPSSHTYSGICPLGSHPMTDPLWSNGATSFVNSDTNASRAAKLEAIAQDPFLLNNVRVCMRNPVENCGACKKCIRTMTTLAILGIKGPFPRMAGARDACRTLEFNAIEPGFAVENYLLAEKRGNKEMARALCKALRRYDRRKAIVYFDRQYLGGTIKRLRDWLYPQPESWVRFPSDRPDVFGLPQPPRDLGGRTRRAWRYRSTDNSKKRRSLTGNLRSAPGRC